MRRTGTLRILFLGIALQCAAAVQAEARPGTRDGYVTLADGVRIHYIERGTARAARPAHGGGGGAACSTTAYADPRLLLRRLGSDAQAAQSTTQGAGPGASRARAQGPYFSGPVADCPWSLHGTLASSQRRRDRGREAPVAGRDPGAVAGVPPDGPA